MGLDKIKVLSLKKIKKTNHFHFSLSPTHIHGQHPSLLLLLCFLSLLLFHTTPNLRSTIFIHKSNNQLHLHLYLFSSLSLSLLLGENQNLPLLFPHVSFSHFSVTNMVEKNYRSVRGGGNDDGRNNDGTFQRWWQRRRSEHRRYVSEVVVATTVGTTAVRGAAVGGRWRRVDICGGRRWREQAVRNSPGINRGEVGVGFIQSHDHGTKFASGICNPLSKTIPNTGLGLKQSNPSPIRCAKHAHKIGRASCRERV